MCSCVSRFISCSAGFRRRRRRTFRKELALLDRCQNAVQASIQMHCPARRRLRLAMWCNAITRSHNSTTADICRVRLACDASRCTRACRPRATKCTCWCANAPICSRICPPLRCSFRRCVPACAATQDCIGPSNRSRSGADNWFNAIELATNTEANSPTGETIPMSSAISNEIKRSKSNQIKTMRWARTIFFGDRVDQGNQLNASKPKDVYTTILYTIYYRRILI